MEARKPGKYWCNGAGQSKWELKLASNEQNDFLITFHVLTFQMLTPTLLLPRIIFSSELYVQTLRALLTYSLLQESPMPSSDSTWYVSSLASEPQSVMPFTSSELSVHTASTQAIFERKN